jgi:hypothetical protein
VTGQASRFNCRAGEPKPPPRAMLVNGGLRFAYPPYELQGKYPSRPIIGCPQPLLRLRH